MRSLAHGTLLCASFALASACPPDAPTAFAARALSSQSVGLTWRDVADNETGFRCERSTDGTTFQSLAALPANAVSHRDAGLTSRTDYFYRIRAFNDAGESAWSPTVQVKTYAGLNDVRVLAELSVNAFGGYEGAGSYAGTGLNGISYSATMHGIALNQPADLWAPPAAQPTPPNTIYGCPNIAFLVATPSPPSSVDFVYKVPWLYVDLTLGIGPPLALTTDAYVLFQDAELSVLMNTTPLPDGQVQIGAPLSSAAKYASFRFESRSSLLNAVLPYFPIGPQVAQAVAEAFRDHLATLGPSLPPYSP